VVIKRINNLCRNFNLITKLINVMEFKTIAISKLYSLHMFVIFSVPKSIYFIVKSFKYRLFFVNY